MGIIIAVALCLSLGAKPKTMTKDFKIQGHVVGKVVDAAKDFSWMKIEAVDIGETSHAGRHYNVFTGILHADGTGTSEGTWTAPGGTLVWTSVVSGDQLVVTIQSGTGKYADAVGGFVGKISNLILKDGILTYDYKGEGDITY